MIGSFLLLKVLQQINNPLIGKTVVVVVLSLITLRSYNTLSQARHPGLEIIKIERPGEKSRRHHMRCVTLPKKATHTSPRKPQMSWHFSKNFRGYKLAAFPSSLFFSSDQKISRDPATAAVDQPKFRLHDFAVARDFRVLWISRRNNLLWCPFGGIGEGVPG